MASWVQDSTKLKFCCCPNRKDPPSWTIILGPTLRKIRLQRSPNGCMFLAYSNQPCQSDCCLGDLGRRIGLDRHVSQIRGTPPWNPPSSRFKFQSGKIISDFLEVQKITDTSQQNNEKKSSNIVIRLMLAIHVSGISLEARAPWGWVEIMAIQSLTLKSFQK